MNDRKTVTISLPTDLIDRMKAMAFSRSTPFAYVTYADIIRETLEAMVKTECTDGANGPNSKGGVNECYED